MEQNIRDDLKFDQENIINNKILDLQYFIINQKQSRTKLESE